MAYSRASAIPEPNTALFSLGAGEGEGARENWAELRESKVGLTGLGGVGVLRAGPWIEEIGAGSISGLPSAGQWVKVRVLGCAGLRVEAEELIVLSGCVSSSTLLLATRVFGQLYLPVN